MPDPLDPLDLANDPTFHQLTRAAQSAPDDRTNQIANQQRDSYVNQTLQSRAQDVYTAQRNQEMDARNQQAQQDANQREQERQAKAQQAQQAKDAAEALRVAKANNVRTERNTETGREEPVFNADNKPVFNPGFTGKPREATANDGTKVPVVDFRNSKGEVAPLPADQVKWDAETRTNQFTDPTTGKLTALPGARPLTQTDPKTGKMTTMTEDPESLTLTPTPIGEDPRTMRTLEFDNRIKDATDKHALLAAQIPMFNDAAKPAHEALSAAQKAFKPFEKDQFRYQDGQIVAVSNSKQFGESLIPVTDPQMQAQAKDWLAKRDAAKKQVDDLSPPVAQAKKEQDARELELRKLAVQTVTLKQAKESHMAAFDAARASNKILGAPDWEKLEADPMASSSARSDLAKTDPSTYQTLTVGEQAVNSAVLNSLTATLNGADPKQLTESQKAVSKSLAPFVDGNGKVDAARFGQSLVAGLGAVAAASSATSSPLTGVAFKAGLEQLGQQFAAQAMADNAIKGLKSGQDTSTPDGMDAAIKAVFPVADPSAFSLNSRTFDVAGKPSTLVDLRNERTNEDVATYFPEDNVMVLGAEAHSKMGTLSAPQVADGGIPLYFGDYSRRLSDDKKSELFKTGVSAQLAGGTSVEIQDRLEAAGLGLPQIKGMLDNGQLSYQEARALKKQLYGLADTDLGQATSVDALQTWMKGNEAYSAMWNRADSIKGVAGTLGSIATGTQRSADMKGQVVTAYFDELFNRSRQTDLAFNRQGMDEARRKLYSEATGKTMPIKAAEFGNEILKQSFGSVAAITIRTGQELAYWTGADKAAAKLTGLDWLKKASDSNSERVSLSYDQTKEWFRNTSTFIAHNFIQPGSEGAAAHQAFGEIALKIADAGNLKGITDAEAVSLRDQMVAFYHADRLTPEEGAKRGFTQDAFDVRKDPAIRAALQDYADTGNPAHMSRAFNLFALDPKARAIEARSQAYVSNARAATADDMQRSAASVYGLKVSPANATALAQIAKEARGVEDPKILAAKFAAAAPLLGVKDAAAAGHILATIGGPVTNDENSWTGYIRTLESADAANVGFEFATTFFPLSKGLKIARVAAGTAAEAAVKAVGEGAINRTLSKGVQMAQTTEKAIAGNLSRFNRVLADSRFGPAFEKVKPYVLGAEEEVAPFFKPKLGQPLSRAKKLGNVVLGNLETIPKIALSEGLEEVAGETGNPNATVDTIADNAAAGFIYGGLGGPMMGVSMLPLAKLGEQRALRASARDRDAWAKATNAIGANVADWKPVTAADYEAYMALMNTGNAQFTIDALAPLTKAYADVSEQLGAAPEGPTTPAVWDLLLKKQDIEQEMAGHHLALAATVANASGALAAIRDADPVKAPFYTASAKVAGGRVDFTDAEAAIIRSTPAAFTVGDTSLQGISGAGEQVAQPKAITLTDAARAQIQSEVPELGVLIETAESSKLFHMEQKAQAAQAEAAATAQATNPTPAPTNSNVKGTPFANLPNDAPATPEQRANIITHVHNHMRAMFPALTGSLNLTTTADATTTASGAGYDFTADTVNMSAPKLADETEGFTAQQTAEHILAAYKEEIDHKAQYSAAQTAYKASGDTRPFEQWRDETYGNIWTKEFTDEQRAAVSGIYESQLEDWKMAFEGLRMIRQAREAGATTEEAKLWGKFKNGATGIVEHFKALLAYLKDLATNGKLPPAIEAEIAAVEKVLSELQEAGKPTAAAVQEKVIGKPEDVTNGKAVTLTTPRNEQSVQATATVVDLAQLVGSDDPRFPSADFQPHDRTGEESKAQALEMKRNLETNPDQWKRYYEGSTTDTGKPVVAPLFENGKHATGADGKPLYYILSGNGRRNAIASLYESGNPANYEAGIRAALATDGIDSSNVTQPVAVAVTQPSSVKDAMKLAEFSNRNAQLSKSTVETAARDAASIQRGNLLNLWDTGENADPTGASNRAFFTAFARATGEPALINSDGRPSEMAVTRAENALLSLMMGDSPAVRSMLERADVLGIRRPLSGIVSRAGQLLKLAQDKPAYDIAPLVREALSSLIRFKEDAAKGLARSIDDHLAQGDMFSAATAPAVNDFARALATAPSAKAVRDVLDEYLRLADAIDTTTGDMFGAAPATRDELLQHAADSRPLTDDVAAFRLAVGEEAQAAQVVAAITPLLSALDGASKSHFRSALDYEQERLKEGIPTALAYQAGFEGEGILDPAAAAVQRWIDSVTPEEATTKLPRIITASKQQRRSIGEVLRAEMAAMTTLNKSSVGIEQPSLFTTVPVEEGRFFGKREKANASFVEKLKYLEAQAKNPALNASQRGTMRATAKRIAADLAKGQGQLFAFDDVAGSQDAAVDALLKRLDGWQTKAQDIAKAKRASKKTAAAAPDLFAPVANSQDNNQPSGGSTNEDLQRQEGQQGQGRQEGLLSPDATIAPEAGAQAPASNLLNDQTANTLPQDDTGTRGDGRSKNPRSTRRVGAGQSDGNPISGSPSDEQRAATDAADKPARGKRARIDSGARVGDVGNTDGRPSAANDGQSNGGTTANLEGSVRDTASRLSKPTAVVRPPVGSPERNHRIEGEGAVAPTTKSARLKANFDAVLLLRKLEEEGRNATTAEKKVLEGYTGWGWIKEAFNETRAKKWAEMVESAKRYYPSGWQANLERRAGYEPELKKLKSWSDEYLDLHNKLKETFTPQEFQTAAKSVRNAHFTSPEVIAAMWQMAERLGFKGGKALEPAGGVGHFIGVQPDHLAEKTAWEAVELDDVTSKILSKLYPEARVNSRMSAPAREVDGMGFQEARIPNNSQDLVISNVPFAKQGPGQSDREFGLQFNLHNYFFARALAKTKPGGLVAFITSANTMEASRAQREWLTAHGELVGAIRLPNTAFKANAGTEVVTDVIFLRKPDGVSKPDAPEGWLDRSKVGESTVTEKRPLVKKTRGYGNTPTPLHEWLSTIDTEKMPVNEDDRQPWKDWTEAGKPKTGLRWKALTDAIGNPDSLDFIAPIYVNEYFARHPEMVLGTHALEGSMYSSGEYTVQPGSAPLREALANVLNKLPKDVIGSSNAPIAPQVEARAAEADDQVDSFVERDGAVYQVTKDGLEPVAWNEGGDDKQAAAKRRIFRSWSKVRDIAYKLIQLEADPRSQEPELDAARALLNSEYDKNLAQNGPLSLRKKNPYKFLSDDPQYTLLQSLEEEERTTNLTTGAVAYKYSKAPIFSQRILSPHEAPTSAGSIAEAVSISMAWRGSLDPAYIAQLTGMNTDDARAAIIEQKAAFENPATGALEVADDYLSGPVAMKLRQAEEAARDNPSYKRNIDALRDALPPRKTIGEATVQLGARWVSPSIYSAFMQKILAYENGNVDFEKLANKWQLSSFSGGTEQWTVGRWSGANILNAILNNKELVIRSDGETNMDATTLLRAKGDEMRDAFVTFVKTTTATVANPEREGEQIAIPDLAENDFNEKVNGIKPPTFQGEWVTLPTQSGEIYLKPFRQAVLARLLTQGRGMMAHGVGSGKTYNQIALAMELRRLGKARKPVIVVQNSTISQFAASFRKAYPQARILVASQTNFGNADRTKFLGRMATGNWDAIILTHDNIGKIPHREDAVEAYFAKELDELNAALGASQRGSDSQNDLQAARDSLMEKRTKMIEALEENQNKGGLSWEDLGVDALIVDEAHSFKNAPVITSRSGKVKNIPTSGVGAQKAISMQLKTANIRTRNNGKGVFFATGTPISNTMAEAYIMLRYIAPDLLEANNLRNFDDFATQYGSTVTTPEANHWGAVEMVERFTKFVNGPAFINLIRSVFDVAMGNESLGIDVPTVAGGKSRQIIMPETPTNRLFNQWVSGTVAKDWKKVTRKDIEAMPALAAVPINTMGAGVAAALDPRMIHDLAPDEPGSKLNEAVKNITAIYKEGQGRKTSQVVFTDLRNGVSMNVLTYLSGNPFAHLGENAGKFSLTDDLLKKLVAAGIPKNEIFVAESQKEEVMAQAFEDVNAGKIRVIIGSTAKLGVGVNIQERLAAAHHLMPPKDFKPAMMEQRNGRIIRQGNLHAEWRDIAYTDVVEKASGQKFEGKKPHERRKLAEAWTTANKREDVNTQAREAAAKFDIQILEYATERSMDSAIYSMMAAKQGMIAQALTSDSVSEDFTDPSDPIMLEMAEMAALAIGDPLLIEQVRLDKDVRELKALQRGFESQSSQRLSDLRSAKNSIEYWERKLPAAESLTKTYGNLFEKREGKPIYTFGGKEIDTALPDGKITAPLNTFLITELQDARSKGNSIAKFTMTVNGLRFVVLVDKAEAEQGGSGHVGIVGNEEEGTAFNGAGGLLSSLRKLVDRATERAAYVKSELAMQARKQADLEAVIAKTGPFARAEELETKKAKLLSLVRELAARSSAAIAADAQQSGPDDMADLPPVKTADPALMLPGVKAVLRDATITGNRLVMPAQLPPKLYKMVNAALESAGGKWSKKAKAHIFASDPSEALGLVDPVKVAEARADDRTLNAASVAREMREATEEDRKLLKIPPAWTDVVVAIDENSPLLAKGKDSKGRWQSIYSSAHSMAALAAKFERLKMVNAAIPDMVARIEIGISNGDEEAHVLRLIYLTGFRNGGEGDTGAKVKAYGATTLLAEHVTVNGDTVSFDFVGKLGVKQQHVVKHAGLATNLALRKNKGERLFNTSPDKVLSYLRKIGGDTFKVHDLRTWNATELANRVIKAEQAPANEVEYWAKRDAVADVVARKLGDTRKIVLESYIDPIVFASWQESANVQNASKPKLGKRDIQEAGSGALLGRTFEDYERSLRDEFLPATGVIGTATRGRLEQGVLLASPVSGPSHQEQALRAALDKASPQFRAMFADFLKDKPIAEIAKVNKLSTVAVQNIVNQMRARYMSALKALQSNLEPKASKDFNPMTGVRSEKIDGGRPDLAGGSIPAMAALDQMRNTSGAPNKMTLDMLEDTARAMFAAEPQAARDMVRVWAENRADLPENYPVPETLKSVMAEARASQSLHALMTMAAKINTFEAAMDANTFNDPARRLDTAMLIMSYRELGTEQARALSARRDPWKTPAERHAAFLMEGLLAPDPDTRAAYKSAETADQRKEILSKWLLRVNDLKASLKADGIDIDSILADYREEQATKKPLEKQYAVVVERADKATRTIVEVLQQGGTPQQAAAAAGLSILEARGKYEALLSRVHNVGVTAARDARVAMLAASPVADYSFAVAAGLHGMSIWDTPTERPSSTKTSAKPKSKAKAVTAVYDGPASTTKGMSAYEQGSLAIHDPRIIAKIADALATRKASGLDKIIEYWKASILSGPQTHIVNSVSNAAFQGYDQWLKRIPEAAVNDMLKMFGQGSDTAPTLSEFGSMIRALPAALGTAFRNSLKAYRSGNATFERYARDLSGEDALAGGEWQKHGHALGGKFGKVMRAISFDLLNAADDFFKTTAGHVEVAAAAHRIAKAEKLNGTAYEARIASLMSPGSEAWERAADYATHVTFQAKIGEGKKTIDKLDAAAVFMNRLKSEKGIKSLDFFIPFIQTPLNIFKIGVEYSPAGSFLALADMIREYRDHSKNTKLHGKDVADALGGQIYDRARFVHDMAQQLVAWGLFFALRGLVTPDDDDGLPFITGSSPWQSVKKGQRDLEGRTVPAQSIRIGSRWFSYGRLEPFATGLTLITDAIKASHQEGGMSRYLSMMVGQLKDKTFLAGLSDVVNWIEDPEKNGNQAVAHIVTGFVPNLIQQPIRNADAAVRDTKPNHKEGFLPELAKRMQYGLLPQSAPPLTDVWGRPVMKNNGDQLNQPATDIPLRIVNPIKNGTTDNVLAIDKYILAHNTKFPTLAWAPQPSPKTIEATIGGQHVSVRLTDKEANDINVNAGKAALASLGSAWDWKNPTEAGMRRIQDSLEHFRRYYRDVAKLNRAGDLQKAAKDKAAVTKP